MRRRSRICGFPTVTGEPCQNTVTDEGNPQRCWEPKHQHSSSSSGNDDTPTSVPPDVLAAVASPTMPSDSKQTGLIDDGSRRVRVDIDKKLRVRFGKAQLRILNSHYATAFNKMPTIWTREIPTACIDRGGVMYANPDFVEPLSDAEIDGVVLHELHHNLLGHFSRMDRFPDAKDGKRISAASKMWLANVATDMEINGMLRDAGYELPEIVIFPETFGFPASLNAESYYEMLLESIQSAEDDDGSGDSSGSSDDDGDDGDGQSSSDDAFKDAVKRAFGDKVDPLEGDEMAKIDELRERAIEEASDREKELLGSAGTRELTQEDADRMLDDVARSAMGDPNGEKQRGVGTGGLTRAVQDRIQPPKIPWQHKLKTQLSASVDKWGSDHTRYDRRTYRTVDKRFTRGFNRVLMRGREYRQPTLQNIHVIVDTSGSMSEDDLGDALAETEGIVRAVSHSNAAETINVYSVDSAVAEHQQVRRLRDLAGGLKGGGGTDMMVGVHAAVEQHKKKLRRDTKPHIIVLTDGYTSWDDKKPDEAGDVIVCLVGEGAAGIDSAPDWATAVRCAD